MKQGPSAIIALRDVQLNTDIGADGSGGTHPVVQILDWAHGDSLDQVVIPLFGHCAGRFFMSLSR